MKMSQYVWPARETIIPQREVRRYIGSQDHQSAQCVGERYAKAQGGESDEDGCVGDSGVGVGVAERVPRRRLISAARDTHT
jgi:hypothetical protein